MNDSVSFFTRLVEWALQGFQNIVTAVINAIGGSANRLFSSLLRFSWKGLLAVVLVVGCALNIIIYMQRWKPHWWWFARKRLIVNDSLVQGKRKKNASSGAPWRKPSTYIPERISTESNQSGHETRLTQDEDIFSAGDDDLMQAGKRKKASGKQR